MKKNCQLWVRVPFAATDLGEADPVSHLVEGDEAVGVLVDLVDDDGQPALALLYRVRKDCFGDCFISHLPGTSESMKQLPNTSIRLHQM